MNELLTKLASAKRRYANVTLPFCGIDVRLQNLTAAELRAYRTEARAKKWTPPQQNDQLLAMTWVDAGGANIITNGELESGILGYMDAGDREVLDNAIERHLGFNEIPNLRAETEAAIKN